MDIQILDEQSLGFMNLYRQDAYGYVAGGENKSMRYAAYHLFTMWMYGRLGAGNRIPIPSCCVLRIRLKFPDAGHNYEGFHAAQDR